MMMILTILMTILTTEVLTSQSFSSQPSDVTVNLGEEVTLPCVVVNRRGIVQWTRDNFGLGIDRDIRWCSRYSMRGAGDDGDYSLKIKDVRIEDDASFQCQVGAVPGVASVQSSSAVVTVQVQPQPPVILNGAQMEIMEASEVEVKCKSWRGKPPAEIKWFDASDKEIEVTGEEEDQNIIDETEDIENSKIKNQISTIKVEITKEMDGTNLTCQASHPTYSEPQRTAILLRVQYKPELTVEQEPSEIKEGDSVKIICKSQSNPPKVMFKWYIDDIIEYDKVKDDDLSDQTSSMEITGIDKSMNGKKIKCSATNKIQNAPYETDKEHTLDVHYAPTFTKEPQDVSTDPGKTVTLECEADGNPTPAYAWFKNGVEDDKVLLSQSTSLSITLSSATVGSYTCRVTVRGYKEIRSSAQVFQYGPPKILPSSDSVVTAKIAADTVLTCDSFAIPLPAKDIVWKFKDMELVNNDHYSIKKIQTRVDGIASSLTIKNILESDFGDYFCSINNGHGNDSSVVRLNRLDESNIVLMVLVSLTVAAMVVLAVMLLVLQCVKMRRAGADLKDTSDSRSNSDSDYSSYTGEDDIEDRVENTVFSDTNSVMTEVSNVASRPQAPPRTRRRYQSSGATSNSIIQNFMPRSFLPRLSVDRLSSIPPPQPQPSMSTFRHPPSVDRLSSIPPPQPQPSLTTFRHPDNLLGHELPLPPPALLHSREITPHKPVTAPMKYEYPSFLRELEARRMETSSQGQVRNQPSSRTTSTYHPLQTPQPGPPPPTHFVSDFTLTGARGKLASLV